MNWRLVEPLVPFTFSLLNVGTFTIIVFRRPGGPDGLWLAAWLLTVLFFAPVMVVCVVVYERRRAAILRERKRR